MVSAAVNPKPCCSRSSVPQSSRCSRSTCSHLHESGSSSSLCVQMQAILDLFPSPTLSKRSKMSVLLAWVHHSCRASSSRCTVFIYPEPAKRLPLSESLPGPLNGRVCGEGAHVGGQKANHEAKTTAAKVTVSTSNNMTQQQGHPN